MIEVWKFLLCIALIASAAFFIYEVIVYLIVSIKLYIVRRKGKKK